MTDQKASSTSVPAAGEQPAQQQTTALRMVVVMGAVGLFAAVALVATYTLTLPRIRANQAEYLARSIAQVLPEASRYSAFVRAGDDGFAPAPEGADGGRIFAGYNDADSLIGLAVEAQGQGYADIIRVIYGFDPACRCVVGLKVLASKETPGLGDKIEKDANFRANFDQLRMREDPGFATLEMVKNGQKTQPFEVEAITGATVSSRAITDLLAASTAILLPLLDAHIDQLKASPAE